MNGSLLLMSDILKPDASFAGMRAFAPVTFVSAGPVILAANANVPARSLSELLALARATPGRISYATSYAYDPVLTPHLQSGKLRALAVASAQRPAALPDVPTFAEAGLPGIEGKGWMGVMVPLGTPEPVIRRLHKEFAAVLKSPDIVAQWVASGAEPGGNTPEEFGRYIDDEYARWGQLTRARGIKMD